MKNRMFKAGDKVRIVVESEDSILEASFEKGDPGEIKALDKDGFGSYIYCICCMEYNYKQWYMQEELELI